MPVNLNEDRAQLTIMKSTQKSLDSLADKIKILSIQLNESSISIQRDIRPLKSNIQSVNLYNEKIIRDILLTVLSRGEKYEMEVDVANLSLPPPFTPNANTTISRFSTLIKYAEAIIG